MNSLSEYYYQPLSRARTEQQRAEGRRRFEAEAVKLRAECRLMVLTGEKPTLAYRINALDSIEDAAAKDFGSQITKGLDKLPIWLGSFTRA